MNGDVERRGFGVERASVKADGCVRHVVDVEMRRAPHFYGFVAEEASGKEQPKAVDDLRGFGVAHEGDVEHTVVRDGAWSLSVAVSRTYAEGECLSANAHTIYGEPYGVFHFMEKQKQSREGV